MEIELTESAHQDARPRVGRRTVIGASVGIGVGGAAVSLLPFLTGKASAASRRAATVPPLKPTSDDIALLAVAQQAELSARDLFDKAQGATGWSAAEAVVIVTIREAHEAFAQSIAALIGSDAPNEADAALVSSLGGGFSGTSSTALRSAMALESALVATHLDLLGRLQGVDGAALVASIHSAEARHTTVLAEMAGMSDLSDLLVDDEADSLLDEA